jgi:hypothetical protein
MLDNNVRVNGLLKSIGVSSQKHWVSRTKGIDRSQCPYAMIHLSLGQMGKALVGNPFGQIGGAAMVRKIIRIAR